MSTTIEQLRNLVNSYPSQSEGRKAIGEVLDILVDHLATLSAARESKCAK
ncbi:hypothetical protein KI809_04340 [Geobacter pelophilus]|uniref:Uncharacterized protein n=1 Tax=Geoanaerobacter pelophilus TaxID=60036 RepID=A0AAW4L150_9BACT|nr:hypothetical protein [Geoanaerobacter pelophilus]MBT0663525.1 hypothetical protein [Geoanaerobacter pelophilus]